MNVNDMHHHFSVMHQGCTWFCLSWKRWWVLPFDRGIPQASSKSQVHRGQIGGMPDYYGFNSSV